MCSQELDWLYRDADQLITPSLNSQLRVLDETNLRWYLIQEMLKVTGWDELLMDDNLFVRGMDSLQVLPLSRQIRHLFCGVLKYETS